MSWKSFKDSLPWLVPSVAIIIGTTGLLNDGVLDRVLGERTSTAAANSTAVPAPAPVPAPAAFPAPAAPTAPIAAPQPAPALAQAVPADSSALTADTSVTRSASGTDLLAVQPARATPQVAAEPDLTQARQNQLLAAARSAAQPSFNPEASFETMRAQCIDDLKQLAQESRVYFPSGGTSADAVGIEQGRLLGLIAQGCRGVRVRVEGHSDASGDPEANLRLSQTRAEEVIRRIGAAGGDTSMFYAEGVGSREPSNIVGPESRAYYDRRVEFVVIDESTQVVSRAPLAVARPWADESCVAELEAAARDTILFYAPGSVSLRADDLSTAMGLAEKAMQCPQARLRVIGHYAGDVGSHETTQTAQLRAKALMAMLVARGAVSEEIIISAPSWPAEDASRTGLPGHRVNFDVILEEG